MKRPLLVVAACGALAPVAAQSALARVDVDLNIGVPAPVYAPPPVYVAPPRRSMHRPRWSIRPIRRHR